MVDVHGAVLAGVRSVNTSGVVSEAIDDLECDRNRAVAEEGSLKLLLITLGNVNRATRDFKSEGLGVNSAFSILSVVWIGLLGGDTTGMLDVLKGVGWETTIATVVVKVLSAVNKLLLSIVVGGAVLDEGVGLEAADSGEGPAGTAVALVLNWRDAVKLSPVPEWWEDVIGSLHRDTLVGGRASLLSLETELLDLVVRLEVLVAHVREGVDALLPSDTWLRVVLDDSLHGGLEVGDPLELLSVGVRRILADRGGVVVPHLHEDLVVDWLLAMEVWLEGLVDVGGGESKESSDSGE